MGTCDKCDGWGHLLNLVAVKGCSPLLFVTAFVSSEDINKRRDVRDINRTIMFLAMFAGITDTTHKMTTIKTV